MSFSKVVITDHRFPGVEIERETLRPLGVEVEEAQCRTAQDVIEAAKDADALLVQLAPISSEVIASLNKCKVIVRYGVGVDNIDLAAAEKRGIAVSNVPNYCVDEVADHTLAMALGLARQVWALDQRLREGTWKLAPVSRMPAFREMTYATAGLGRIGQAVLQRARNFKFRLAAYDPYRADDVFQALGVERWTQDQLFREADILSLHIPLNRESYHLVNRERLRQMKSSAILINTARGGLVDTKALADELQSGTLGYAGLDVFEQEPVPENHPLRSCKNLVMTSHVAWISESSVPKLQSMAAEEVARALQGRPLLNPVSRKRQLNAPLLASSHEQFVSLKS